METDGLGFEETKPPISIHSKEPSGGDSGFQKVGEQEHATPTAINVRFSASILLGRAYFARFEVMITVVLAVRLL